MTVTEKIISGVLELIQLSGSDVEKVISFDPDAEITGKGVVTADLVLAPAHADAPDLPDYEITLSVRGMTYMSEDPKQEIIQTVFEDCLHSLSGVSVDSVQHFFPDESTVFAVFPSGERRIESGIDDFMFTLNYKIVVGNLLF